MATRDHIGRSTGNSNPVMHCPQLVLREILHNSLIIKTNKWKVSTLLKLAYMPVIDEALDFNSV